MDAIGSAIRIDTRGREVMRILPRTNDDINEEWISDKTRHVVDGLRTQRLDQPYVRVNGRLQPATWQEAFGVIAGKVKAAPRNRVGALAGQLSGVEEMFALKSLMAALGVSNIDARYPGSPLHPKYGRASYLFNSTIAGIEQSDAIMLIGANPRREAPVLNARIRKRWRRGNIALGLIGEKADLTYPLTYYVGAGPESLAQYADHKPVNAEKPMFIIGQGALNRPDGAAVLAMAAKAAHSMGVIKDGWNGFNILHSEAALVGALDIGFVPGDGGLDTGGMLRPKALDILFLLGVDEVEVPAGSFVVYIGTHGDRGAHRADVILPGAAYPEKSAIYVNTEGRVQMANRAAFPPGEAREDWAILRALSDVLGCKLPFDSLAVLRQKLFAAHPHLMQIDQIAPGDAADIAKLAKLGGTPDKAPFGSAVGDFYLSNPIARASAVMAECSALAQAAARNHPLTAAE
jgi:NADH-quinone oxidoreductase subunit G